MDTTTSQRQVSRSAFVGGPYSAPVVKAGDWLDDEIDGRMEVGGYSAGLIPWPRRRKTGRASLILCGDLVKAVRAESALAIAANFGVGGGTVSRWRLALGVDRKNNEGTQTLYRSYASAKLTADRAARGREAAAQPDALAKMAANKTGKPAHPSVRAGLLRAAKGPKPAGWGRRANRWMREAKGLASSDQPDTNEDIT